MNYTKPRVVVLGQAVRVIEGYTAKAMPYAHPDGGQTWFNPAYDLDE
ncbi:MAG: hypothetical protein WB729_05370 [Candidatus Sulfotelmatobacter sp.]